MNPTRVETPFRGFEDETTNPSRPVTGIPVALDTLYRGPVWRTQSFDMETLDTYLLIGPSTKRVPLHHLTHLWEVRKAAVRVLDSCRAYRSTMSHSRALRAQALTAQENIANYVLQELSLGALAREAVKRRAVAITCVLAGITAFYVAPIFHSV